MLHACFVYDPTCFMCIFIQYLAFSGTNLFTRCHSASSCFLLFLYFRKVTYEIFSELDQTKAKVPNIPEDSGSQKGSCWRAMISHKYRGSCVAFSISKSVEPNEELKVG